ncbi:MAG: hypothetical protein Q4G52_04630 [Clostridia bacterium]|nr:hypothetical protein [Clostridia bacterium]
MRKRQRIGAKRLAALALAALVSAAIPAGALAAERAPMPLAPEEASEPSGETLRPFGQTRGSRGVTASNAWLEQARIGGLMLSLRLFTPEGDAVTFEENLRPVASNAPEMDLELRASKWNGGLILELDQHALDVLARVGVVRIVVADMDYAVRASYEVEELAAIRTLFALGEKELLCVGAEDIPVTVVSEDGVRRQLTQ